MSAQFKVNEILVQKINPTENKEAVYTQEIFSYLREIITQN